MYIVYGILCILTCPVNVILGFGPIGIYNVNVISGFGPIGIYRDSSQLLRLCSRWLYGHCCPQCIYPISHQRTCHLVTLPTSHPLLKIYGQGPDEPVKIQQFLKNFLSADKKIVVKFYDTLLNCCHSPKASLLRR